ncbi:MAG: SDR family oxidoreductase [Gammaproteobacteria bacterium]|nr:SDR family oxidoreductase [Gammaproteobacteria bacterium]
MSRLKGKTAVILGAAAKDNMGQIIARRYAAEGAKVVISGRKENALKELADEIGGAFTLCDITSKEEVEALAQFAQDQYGEVSIAINCAGWGLLEKLQKTSEEQLNAVTALHINGTFFFLQVFTEHMSKGSAGSIILTSSASVYCTLYHHAAYIGSKAGADAVMRCFANEYGSKGIKINAIAPGLTSTPMTENEINMPGLLDAFLKEYPMGRIGTTDDVANAALWLGSDESFMSGQVLQINGGLTLRRNPLPWEINASMKAAAESDN